MTEAFFGDIRSKIVDRLDTAESSLRIAMAWFTNPVLFQLVLDKAAGGTKVELILSDSEANFRANSGLNFNALQRKGAKIHVVRSGESYQFMHHKFVIIDNKEIITGSYNWSNNAHTNFENILITDDPKTVKTYSLQFEELIKKVAAIALCELKPSINETSVADIQKADIAMLQLANEFNQEVDNAMAEAEALKLGLRMDIIDGMLRRYTAVGAAKKLSNDVEQSGFLKLVTENRAYLTFEYLTAKSYYAPLFDKLTIKKAKDKLRPYIGNMVEDL